MFSECESERRVRKGLHLVVTLYLVAGTSCVERLVRVEWVRRCG